MAKEGDTVVIAGKGHEEIQILGGERVPFKDGEEVVRALRGTGSRELAVG
jgi:UDP-N-acetylmuramoyl-L-alanyl-D-glutamate--2,6-diaminopimelate ligase